MAPVSSPTSTCSASRTSLLTGRMPSQHGVHDWLSNGNGCGQRVVNFSAAETFYTDRLAESGFDQIGLSGKFHLGNSEQALHGYNWWQFVHQSGGGSYIEPPIVANGSCVTLKGYVTDMIADDAVRFVHTHGKAPKWYLGVHFTAPHAPYYGKDGKAASMHPPSVVALYENTSFDSVPNLSLAVEHGFHYRIRNGPWTQLNPGVKTDWRDVAEAIVKVYTTRTNGSFYQKKVLASKWRSNESP